MLAYIRAIGGDSMEKLKKTGEKTKGKNRLTLKQQKFADYYLELGNATEAARRAGYSESTARQAGSANLKRPDVDAYIQKRLQDLEDKAIAKQDEVLRYLTSVMRGESTSEVVVTELCGDGESEARTIKKRPDEKEKLQAAKMLGQRYGTFTDKVSVDGTVPVIIQGADELEE